MLWDGILNSNSPIFCRFRFHFKPFLTFHKNPECHDPKTIIYCDPYIIWIPSRERSHIPPWEKENHLQNAILEGYVSSLEGSMSSPIYKNTPTTNRSLPLVCFHHQDTDPPQGGCLCATLTDDELRHSRHRRRERTNNFGW